MTPFFSIISTKTNSFSNEKIAVGLIFISNKVYFKYSTNKLNWLKKLNQGEELYFLAKSSLMKIEKAIKADGLSASTKLFKNQFSKEYFSYLNQYAAGVISFSEPTSLNIPVDQSVFENYYEKIIGENFSQIRQVSVKQESFKGEVKDIFIKNEAEKFADLDYVFKVNEIESILKDFKLPFITKNGSVQGLNIIDFTKQQNTIISNIYETEVLYEGLWKFCNQNGFTLSKLKLAIELPEDKEKTNFFDLVYKEKKDIFEFEELDAVEKFIEQAAKSGTYHKFSKDL